MCVVMSLKRVILAVCALNFPKRANLGACDGSCRRKERLAVGACVRWCRCWNERLILGACAGVM